MDTFVEPISLSNVESGGAGEDAHYMLQLWRQNNGIISRDKRMNWISRKLMMFLPEHVEGDVPPATFIGKDSTFKRYFPQTDHPMELPKLYRQKVAHGYQVALQGEPWHDIQKTGELMGKGTPDLTLERLILKFRTSAGFERIFCLMRVLEEPQGYDLSNRGHHHVHCPPGTGYYQSESGHHLPIAQHWGRPL